MRRRWNRPLAVLLTVCMLLSQLPMALAEEAAEAGENTTQAVQPEVPAVEDENNTPGPPATENAEETEETDSPEPGDPADPEPAPDPEDPASGEPDPDEPEPGTDDSELVEPETPADPEETDPEEPGENDPDITEPDTPEDPEPVPDPDVEQPETPPTEEEDQDPDEPPASEDQDQTLGDILDSITDGMLEEILDVLDFPSVFAGVSGGVEYLLDTDGIDSGAVYAIYTNVASNSYNRILYHTGTGMTDKVQSENPGDLVTDSLPLNSKFDASRQLWVITAAGDGYTVQSVDSGRYLDLTSSTTANISTSASAVVLQIDLDSDGTYTIWQKSGAVVSYNGNGNIYAGVEAASLRLFKQTTGEPEIPEVPEVPALPEPGEGELWAYVGFTSAWGLSTNPYEVKLYSLENTSAASGTAADRVEDGGYYLIAAPTVKDGGRARLMHVASGNTQSNQCQIGAGVDIQGDTLAVGGCGISHMFQLIRNENGTYRIKSAAAGNYLNVGAGSLNYEQLPFGAESAATEFVVQAGSETGKFTLTAIVRDPNYVDPEDDPPFKFPVVGSGQAIVYQQVTSADGLLTDGELFAFVDDTPYTGNPRILYHATGTGKTDQLEISAGETLSLHGQFAKERQLWSLVAVDGGYKLKSWDDGLYLTTTATGDQLVVNETGSVFTLERTADGWQVMSEGKYLDFGGRWKMVDTAGALKVYTPTLVAVTGDLAETVFKGTSSKPMSQSDTGSTSFRIPALITLDNGWLMAASDIRWRTTADSPQNLDTIVSISKDGGSSWEWEVVNYWADMANTTTNQTSASFIDPSIVQDRNGKIHMIVDACPSYVGLMYGNRMGSACTGFDSQGRMLVAKGTADADAPTSTSAYTYYVDLNAPGQYHPICASDGTPSGYFVDAFLNLYQGEEYTPVMCLQQGATGKIVQSNLFYRQSEWKAFPTFFIMHRTAVIGNDGLVWSDPTFLDVKSSGESFLGVCPGRGTLTDTGRIVFPLYDNATGNELASVIYSDNGGVSWNRGARANSLNGTGKSSESQIVRLPDGTLRMYSRNTLSYISYADSSNNGASWGQYTTDTALHYGSNVMVSFINAEGYLTSPDGTVYQNLILASYPWGTIQSGEHNRSNGVVRIGSIGADNTVTWLNSDDVRYPGRFNYSCLTQLQDPNGRFGLLYEEDRSNNMDIHFKVLTAADLLGAGWSFSLTAPETPGSGQVTDASGRPIAAVNGVYTIPAGGMVYEENSDTAVFTVPQGVAELRVPADKAERLALGENGSLALEGMTVVLPNGDQASALAGSGQCGDSMYYALVQDGSASARAAAGTRLHISGNGPMWNMFTSADYASSFPDSVLRPYQALVSGIQWAKVYDGVTSIGDYAFYGADLSQGIELPETLETIGREAFTNTRMPEITIPEGVTSIGTRAFYGAGQKMLMSTPAKLVVHLPDSLTELGANVFAFSYLTEITVPAGVKQIPSMTFYACQYLNRVTILGAEEIGANAFGASGTYTTGTIALSLPETLTTIQERAFNNAKVRSLTIPASVTSINGTNVFGSQLRSLRFLGAPAISANAFNEALNASMTMVVYVPNGQVLEELSASLDTINGKYVVANLNGHDTTLQTASPGYLYHPVKGDVTSLWYDAEGNALTQGVYYTTVPASAERGTVFTAGTTEAGVTVTTADGQTIQAANGVYVIPAGGVVKKGDEVLFTVPMGVTSIRLPEQQAETVKLGDNGAVAAVAGMSILLPDGTETASLAQSGACGKTGTDAVYFVTTADYKVVISGQGAMVDYPNNYSNPFGYTVKEVVVTQGVTSIGAWAFYGKTCTSVALPEGLLSIGASAFRDCGQLAAIDIPDSVSSIGADAFMDCSSLTRLDFPAGMTAVPASLFGSNVPVHLTKVTFQGAVESIGSKAFYRTGANSALGVVLFRNSSPRTVDASAFYSKAWNGSASYGLAEGAVIYTQGAPSASMKTAAVNGRAYLADLNGGSLPDDIFNTLASNLLPETLPALEGKVFVGWLASSNGQLVTARSQWSKNFSVSGYPKGTVFTAQWGEAEHTWSEWEETRLATCTQPGEQTRTCSTCGEVETAVIPALGHDVIAHEAHPATCTESGWNAYESCSRCDYSTYEEIAALGHDVIAHEARPATCTESGWNAYETCSHCDYSTYEEIAALGHSIVTHAGRPATCTESGWNAYETCSRCNYTTYTAIAALGHDFTGEYAHDEEGHWHVCTRCDAADEKAEHTWDEGVVTLAPTYSAVGVRTYTCTVCGAERTEEIPRLTRPSSGSSSSGGSSGGSSSRPSTTPPVVEIEDTETPLVELPYVDVAPEMWYQEAIAYVYSNGLMQGSGSEFAPDVNTDRGTIAQVLYNLSGHSEAGSMSRSFLDVAEDTENAEAILWCVSHGLAAGYVNGNFGPRDHVTREQMAVLLYGYAKFMGMDVTVEEDVLQGFTDSASISDWAREAVAWAVSRGLLTGYADGRMAPEANATRAQVAAVVMQFHQMQEQQEQDTAME